MRLKINFAGIAGEIYPYFIGSFIRGNFGMYLKKTICPFAARRPCEDCLIHKKCFYAEIFESQKEESTSGRDIPHPFVFDIFEDDRPTGEKRSDLEFHILLFGPALKNYEFFILVFSEMGRKGIGKKRLKVKNVIIKDNEDQLIYSHDKGKILHSPRIQDFEFNSKKPSHHVVVSYKTPVRLLKEGKEIKNPNFEILIRSALRRLIYLEENYGTPPALPTAEIIASCAKVKTLFNNVRWENRYRYSHKHKKKMNLGGLLGTQEFSGELSPLHLDLLGFVSIFHVGKSTSFGHGKIDVKIKNI